MKTGKDMGQDQTGPFDFSSIQEVKLGHGAHKSAAEGMCFMEMVAWFAGEAHSDKPACACIVLGRYGMALNDRMPNDLRDELLKPLVPMIAGTSGSLDDRIARARFLAMWSINKVLSALMRRRGQEALAIACEIATDIPEARAAAQAVRKWAAYAADAADAVDAVDAAFRIESRTETVWTWSWSRDYSLSHGRPCQSRYPTPDAVHMQRGADFHFLFYQR